MHTAVNSILLSRKTGWCLDSHEVRIEARVLYHNSVSDCIRLSVAIVVSGRVCRRNGDLSTCASIVVRVRWRQSISDLLDCDSLLIFIVDNLVLDS